MVAHTSDPSTQETDREISEFKASLVYIVSEQPETLSQKNSREASEVFSRRVQSEGLLQAGK